jgi:hypothetical protein
MAEVIMTVQRNVRLDSETFLQSSEDFSGSSGEKVAETIPASSTNFPIAGWGGFDSAYLKSIWFSADQDCTLAFVSGTHSYDFNLLANGTFLWCDTDGFTNPFGGEEITALEVTCTAATELLGRICVGS